MNSQSESIEMVLLWEFCHPADLPANRSTDGQSETFRPVSS